MSFGACSIGTSLKNKADYSVLYGNSVTAMSEFPWYYTVLWLFLQAFNPNTLSERWCQGILWMDEGKNGMDRCRVWAWEREREKGVGGVCIALCAKNYFSLLSLFSRRHTLYSFRTCEKWHWSSRVSRVGGCSVRLLALVIPLQKNHIHFPCDHNNVKCQKLNHSGNLDRWIWEWTDWV